MSTRGESAALKCGGGLLNELDVNVGQMGSGLTY